MKGKRKKHKPTNEENNDDNPENQDNENGDRNDDVMEDTMPEKKSKVHIPARFIGRR